MKMEPIVSSETSAIKTQTPGNYPKRNKLQANSRFSKIYEFAQKIGLEILIERDTSDLLAVQVS